MSACRSDVTWQGRTVHTGIWKAPVKGRRMVRRLNIDGDGQGDLAGHGGERRAVFVYQMDSYRYWQDHLGRSDFTYGQFGENFTVDGLSDAEVCIGDRYRIGGALFEVTQPRVTCYRLGIRMNEPEMAALVVKHGRPGFYFRVLEEGEVEAGNEITRVASGPERMSVSEIDALLYMPGHPRDQLEHALRIPALSPGWRSSFEALLTQERKRRRDDGKRRARRSVRSTAGVAWIPPASRLAQSARERQRDFAGARAHGWTTYGRGPPRPVYRAAASPPSAPALMRSYSLSGEPSAASYRVSVKREAHGAASAYVNDELQVGDMVQASAARGSFTLRPGDTPVVLLSAGIGVTPVLAMLHALAAEASTREIWWLYGTRNGREHPFAEEARALLKALAHRHSHICYSSPDPEDRPNVDFDAPGRLNMQVLQELDLPRNGDFYICGPSTFMSDLTAGLAAWGVAPDRIHTETFRRRSVHYAGHCRFAASAAALAGGAFRLRTAGLVRPQRSQCPLGADVPELARTGRSLRRAGAMVVSNRASATPVRPGL